MKIFYGETREGDPEFGESYHAAAFLAASADHKVEIVGNEDNWSLASEFLNQIREGSTTIIGKGARSDGESIGMSADRFLKLKNSNLPGLVADKIATLLTVTDDVKRVSKRFYSEKPSCFLWTRHGKYQPERNLTGFAFHQLIEVL
ncbi:MAG: hypothetical protein MI807_02615, partial [Verrucomicrobiales bacterium]|nr:hypothetical protein [Verrucomicrobiales bacterium]